MKFADYIVTKPSDKELFTKMMTMLRPDLVIDVKSIYVYPHIYKGLETTSIRFQIEREGKESSLTYNLLSTRLNVLKEKIRNEKWEWLLDVNRDLDLSVYAVGPRREHSIKNNQFLVHPLCLNLNLSSIELPLSVMEAEVNYPEFDGLFNGDLKHIDLRFKKFASVMKDGINQIQANFRVIEGDINIKRDHDLYFAFGTDIDTTRIYACLTKVPAHLQGKEMVINNKPVDQTDFVDFSPMGRHAVQTITGVADSLNERLNSYVEEASKNPALKEYAMEMVKATFVMLGQTSHHIYKFSAEDGKELIESKANEILLALASMKDIRPGLDLNSWHLYDYTDASEPVRVRDVKVIEDLMDNYTPSFVDALYSHMLNIADPLLRPYAKIIPVAEENIKDHAVGSIRVA